MIQNLLHMNPMFKPMLETEKKKFPFVFLFFFFLLEKIIYHDYNYTLFIYYHIFTRKSHLESYLEFFVSLKFFFFLELQIDQKNY